MADSRFKGTRGVQMKDINETAVVDAIKEQLAKHGGDRRKALDAVAQQRKTSLREITRIADRNGL